MKNLEKILKALANRRRLAILSVLMKLKEMNVADIAEEINLSFKSTSRHLAVLSGLDILEKEQRRLYMFYRLGKTHFSLIKFVLAYTPYSHE